jgi:hypothetical protein
VVCSDECRSNIDSARVLLTAGHLTGLYSNSQWFKTAIFSARPKTGGAAKIVNNVCANAFEIGLDEARDPFAQRVQQVTPTGT